MSADSRRSWNDPSRHGPGASIRPAGDGPAPRGLRIALISPAFKPSFFGAEYALPLYSPHLRSHMIPGALPALAALTPAPHHMDVFDEQVAPVPFDRLGAYDVIGVTGLIVQRDRMLDILDRLRGTDALIVVGGPYATVDPACFQDHADVLFLGEAEETWPAFLDDLAHDRVTRARYEQPAKTDMITVPTPRFDLFDPIRYVSAPIQFSRGCPFLCEFCDIIVMFGRRPRLKSPDQILAEVEAARAAGFSRIFIVDDNFIGNKKAAIALLTVLVDWQERHGFPVTFATEASVDLADFPELLDLMVAANFVSVFIGIETPNPEALAETRKVQNLRGDSLSNKLLRIRRAGLIIESGFIVGFDADGPDIFENQYAFIMDNALANTVVSILAAIPTTPLFARLEKEGRLRLDDPLCNFQPAGMTVETLKAGFRDLYYRLFLPDAYFERIFRDIERGGDAIGERAHGIARRRAALGLRGAGPLGALRSVGGLGAALWRFARALGNTAQGGDLRRSYLRLYRAQKARLGTRALGPAQFANICFRHFHFHRLSADMREGQAESVNAYSYSTGEPGPH
ncbi:MAG: radical SAM protein [Marinibacterium sp.]